MLETNELSKSAKGGTELMLEALHNNVPMDLLDKFQIIPSRVREIDPDRKAVLWLHDLAGDPEAEHLKEAASRDRFAAHVFVSHWQMQMYNLVLGFPYHKGVVLQNAIVPIPQHEKLNDGVVRLIYHTTPHRGLGIVVPVFEHLHKVFQDRGVQIHLDVYSSFAIYGWADRDKPYQELFDRCKNHPAISYHGSVPNSEIRTALQKSDIFAYPCIWEETSCIAAIEALSAKNVIVCPNLAALPETCANFAMMYQFSEDAQEHANRFANSLAQTITAVKLAKDEQIPEAANMMNFQKQYIDGFYNWDLRAAQWTRLLQTL